MSATLAIEDLRRWCLLLLASGCARKKLARNAGLGERTLWNVESEAWNPSARTIRKLDAHRHQLEASYVAKPGKPCPPLVAEAA